MENWGLITYGEGYLITEMVSPPQDKLDVASVIAHELSHQVLPALYINLIFFIHSPNIYFVSFSHFSGLVT